MIRMRIAAPAVLTLVLLSALTTPRAFAGKPPGGGSTIDPATHCSAAGPTVITLDPGHGGADSGTGYDFDDDGTNDLLEKTVVLNIAELTREILKSKGYTVCLTRTTDSENPGNSERGQFANTVGASLFVMIHLNGSSDRTVNYTKTFWGKRSKDLDFSTFMYGVLAQQLATPGAGGVGQFASGAMLKATMPSTLAESVFLTNTAEANALRETSSPRRQAIAQALADGIDGYLTR